MALVGPDQLRDAEAAQRAGRRAVGVERVGIDADIVDVVGPRRGEAGFLGDARADIGVGAAIPEHLAGPRRDAAVVADAALDAERRRMLGDDVELFFHGQRDLDWPAHDQRQRRHQRFELDIDLGAEAAAEMRHLHPDAVFRPAEQPRDLRAHERRRLARRMDRQHAVAGLGHRDERLERQMQALLGLEGMRDNAIGARHGGIDVAAPQVIVERHIGAGAALEVFEIGKRAGRLEHVVNDDVGRHGGDFVIDRRQLVVLRADRLHGLVGDMRIAGQDHRHRLADMAHLVDRQDRLIVKRRAVIGLRNELLDVGSGDHPMHARHGARRRGVEAADAAVRHGGAEHLAVQHAGQAQMMGVVGAAGHLGAHFKPRDRLADPAHCALTSNAWRTARRR